MEQMEGRLTSVEHSLLTSNHVQERMLTTLEQLNDKLLLVANLIHRPITEPPPPPRFANMGAQLERLTERFSNLETRTAGISSDVTANRLQMNLVLATTNSLTAAIEGQRRELTSTRVLQQEAPVQQQLDMIPVEHEDRGLQTIDREVSDRSLQTDFPQLTLALRPMENQGSQTPHRELQEQGFQTAYQELQDRGLQTLSWQVSSRDAGTKISFNSLLQAKSTTPVARSPPVPELEPEPSMEPEPVPTEAVPFPGTTIPSANPWLEGLSPLTTMSSIDTMPTFSVSGPSEEPETPQEAVVQQAPEVLLRRSARGGSKVKTV
jgi:hypothetical protein